MRHFLHTLFAAAFMAATMFEAAGQSPQDELTRAEARRQTRLFDEHVVRMGETAFSISRGYAISPRILAEDNPGVELTRIKTGQVLLIRKKERGKTEPTAVAREWQQMVDGTAPSVTQAGGWAPLGGEPPAESGEAGQSAVQEGQSLSDAPEGRPDEFLAGRGGERRGLRDFSRGGTPRVALMLPLTGTNASAAGNSFTDFYKGTLLGLENLKAQGRSVTMTLYDSERSRDKVQDVVTDAGFIDTDLVIGPVFEDEMEPAVRFGEFFGVPVVSPLDVVQNLDSNVIYQMTPDAGAKYDKLRPLLERDDTNVVLVSSPTGNDAEFEREITAELGGRAYGRFTIGGQGEIASLMDWQRPNVLIVLSGSEETVDRALTSIASSYNKRARRADLTVVGTSKWTNYNLGKHLYFELGVKLVTNYYIDRSDMNTRLFEARYIEVYGDFPSKAAFRGYDAVTLFVGALFENGTSLDDRLERVGASPLATPYRFVRAGIPHGDGPAGGSLFGGGYADTPRKRINEEWTLVSFTTDFNITTE